MIKFQHAGTLRTCCGVLEIGQFYATLEKGLAAIENGTYAWDELGKVVYSVCYPLPAVIATSGGSGLSQDVIDNLEIPGYEKNVVTTECVNPNSGNYITICTWIRKA